MDNSQYFVAKDYLRAFDLKNLFHEYVVIYSQINFPDGEVALSKKDRYELTLKLEETMNKITLLVLKMKEPKSENGSEKKTILPALGLTKATSESRLAN